MSLDLITLQTNKSITVANNNIRVIRQSEKGLVLPVALLNTNGVPYDLTGKSLVFSETKTSNKIVIDDGTGDNAGKFQITDAKNGKFNYTLQAQVYAASGEAWFEIKNGDTVVDTTQNFKFNVLEEANINVSNSDYVSSLKALQSHLQGTIDKAEASINDTAKNLTNTSNKAKQDAINAINQAKNTATTTLNNLNSQYSSYLSKYQKLEADLKTQQAKIQNDADSKIKAIQDTAAKQKQDIQTKADSTISASDKALKDELAKIEADRQSSINKINSDSQAALKTAQSNYNNQLSSIQNDYNTWKKQTTDKFNSDISGLSKQLSDQHKENADLKAYLDEIKTGVDNAEKQFDKIDFTRYVTHDQFEEMKKTKANGLRVRGLGGEYVMAVATDGNIDGTPTTSQPGLADLGVLSGAIQIMADAILDKNHYTKTEVDKMKQDVINQVNKKANSADLQNTNNRVSSLEKAGYVKAKFSGFSSDTEAAQWAKTNHGIAYFED